MIVAAALALALMAPRGSATRRPPDWRIRRSSVDVAAYFDAVAGELRRGAALRQALAIPAPGTRLERLSLTGQPMELVAAEMEKMLGRDNALAVAGVRLAGRTGAPALRVVLRLAERARRDRQFDRDRSILSAQARLSAAVVGLLPVMVSLLVLASGRIGLLAAPGPARTAVLIGLGLQLAGLLVIGALLRRHR